MARLIHWASRRHNAVDLLTYYMLVWDLQGKVGGKANLSLSRGYQPTDLIHAPERHYGKDDVPDGGKR
jgi:hypothetical protein